MIDDIDVSKVRTLTEAEKAEIWAELKTMTPYYEAYSLHIYEARYCPMGLTYIAYWALGSSDEVPCQIDLCT